MKDFLSVNEFGMIEEVRLDGQEIPFRSGEWAGPAWQVAYGGETHAERKDARPEGEDWQLRFWAIRLKRSLSVQDGVASLYDFAPPGVVLCIRGNERGVFGRRGP